jgi:ABC-type transporter Mla subunit MlaD
MALQDLTPQLRTRLRRVEKIVGLFVTLATLVLVTGFVYYLYHTAARKGWFVAKAQYYTFAMTAEGLNVGDNVKLMGFDVGQITVIETEPPGSWYGVFIGFEVRRPYYGYIWSDSKVRIAVADFLGRRQLELVKGYDGLPTIYEEHGRVARMLAKGQQVPVAELKQGVFVPPLEEPALTERAEKLLTQIEAALPHVFSLTNQLHATLVNLSQLTASAVELTSNANHLVVGAQPIVTNLVTITTRLQDPHGSLGEWLIPTNINAQLTATLGSANALVTNLNQQVTVLSSGLNDTLLNLAGITGNLRLQVEANDQILAELSRLLVETDDLVQGLKRHWLLRGAFGQTPDPPTDQLLELQLAPLPARRP